MAISQYSDMMDTCGGETPYFCVHNNMCYGHDQYCHKDEDKIMECLPLNDAFNWCKNNALNVSALPDPQCAKACAYKYNTTHLPTPVDQLGGGGVDNSNIAYQITVGVLIAIVVVLVIGNAVQRVWYKRLFREKKALESLLEDDGICMTKWQQKEPANIDKTIDKKKERHLSWEEEPSAEESSETTVFVGMTELQQNGLGDIGVSERRTESDRGDESAGSPLSDATSARSGGLGDESGYDSRGPNVDGDDRTMPNRGPNETHPSADQLGQSGSAVLFGLPCRTPHPMPSSDQTDGVICTSFSRSRSNYSDPVLD